MHTVYSARRPEIVRFGSAMFLRDSTGKLYTLGNVPVKNAEMTRIKIGNAHPSPLARIRFVFR